MENSIAGAKQSFCNIAFPIPKGSLHDEGVGNEITYRATADGVLAGLRAQRRDDLLLICGSHYVAGEALPVLHEELRRKSS